MEQDGKKRKALSYSKGIKIIEQAKTEQRGTNWFPRSPKARPGDLSESQKVKAWSVNDN